MAKPSQTFKKRQREIKLREKAQLKRQRRQQRQEDRKAGIPGGGEIGPAHQYDPFEPMEAVDEPVGVK